MKSNKKTVKLIISLVTMLFLVGGYLLSSGQINNTEKQIYEEKTSEIEKNTNINNENYNSAEIFPQEKLSQAFVFEDPCDRKTKLSSDTIYATSIDNNNLYYSATDSLGRVKASIAFSVNDKTHEDRKCSNLYTPIGFVKNQDNRGHLIADQFGGTSTPANIVAQLESTNLKTYKAHENKISKALDNKLVVTNFFVEVHYIGMEERPDYFLVSYEINDGTVVSKELIKNNE